MKGPLDRSQAGALMDSGPQSMTHAARWELANHIAAQFQHHFSQRLLALGVYGSLARGSDAPYSDIEMHCVIKGSQIDTSYEWSAGPWKAEVDVYSPDVILANAALVDGDWSITHAAYYLVKPIHDPGGFFLELSQVVFSHPDEVFHRRMAEVIVGDIYEMVGKIRNACHLKQHASLPVYAVKLAEFSAGLMGLRHRHLFTSSRQVFLEALGLADPPAGFVPLIEMVMAGVLSDPARILTVSNDYWKGLELWASQLDLPIITTLEALLLGQGTEPGSLLEETC